MAGKELKSIQINFNINSHIGNLQTMNCTILNFLI